MEPTNIIWENRHWTTNDYIKRSFIAFFLIFVLLMISFLMIYQSKLASIEFNDKYPAVNCASIKQTFQRGQNDLQTYAIREHKNFYNSGSAADDMKASLQGPLKCFCEENMNKLDFGYSTKSKVFSQQAAMNYNFPICNEFVQDNLRNLFFSRSVQFMIIGINYVLRLFIIKLIIFIGKDTETEQTRLTTNGIFIVQFFNTAILLLLCNANLYEQGLGLFNGKLSDFDAIWFNDIGSTLVGAMMFNVYWPAMEFSVWLGYRIGFRMLDRCFRCDKHNTKKITIQQYVELYSGPTFFIHYKYSSILNITFVTMMYGVGLPVLFPVAAVSLFTLYMVEKLMVHYCYRQPPMYDASLNENVLRIMSFAPLLFLIFGYWMLTNVQLFSNTVLDIAYDQDNRLSGHVWTSLFSSASFSVRNPAMPLLLCFWVFFVLIMLNSFFFKYL